MNDKQLIQLIGINILLILWISIDAFFLKVVNTTLVWLIGFLFYIVFFKGFKFKDNFKGDWFIKGYLYWVLGTCCFGIIQAESYWDYKGLIYNSFSLLFPISVYALSNLYIVQNVLRTYIKYAIPFFFVFILVAPNNIYGYYLSPITLLLLFFPLLENKYKIMMVLMAVLVFAGSLGARTTIISFTATVLLLLFSYIKFLNKKNIFNFIRFFLLFGPFVLFILASLNIFNIFKLDEIIGTEIKTERVDSKGTTRDESLLVDTRSFLYKEVLVSAIKNDYWLFGRSPARGNDTVYFAIMDMNENRSERLRNEVGICNVFTWTGLIGVCLYFLIFVKASYLAINHSKNNMSKLLGIYISFRWCNSWIAEITNFILSYFTIWIAVALCFSKGFRSMTDKELKFWVRGITNREFNNVLQGRKINFLKRKI